MDPIDYATIRAIREPRDKLSSDTINNRDADRETHMIADAVWVQLQGKYPIPYSILATINSEITQATKEATEEP